ncbi:hypothetical protein CGRA01v4_02360 [Colletotrichum graminicola]|nr:hypothetical protein CGRA01v4_02360 [Colletotrichum graminicola]
MFAAVGTPSTKAIEIKQARGLLYPDFSFTPPTFLDRAWSQPWNTVRTPDHGPWTTIVKVSRTSTLESKRHDSTQACSARITPYPACTREGLFALVGQPSPFSMVKRLVDVENGSTVRFGGPLLGVGGFHHSFEYNRASAHPETKGGENRRQVLEELLSDKDQEQSLSVNGLALESRSRERATRASLVGKVQARSIGRPGEFEILSNAAKKQERRNQTGDKKMGFDGSRSNQKQQQ